MINSSWILPLINDGFYIALVSLVPFMLVIFIIALLAPMAIGGISYSVQAMAFKYSRID
ncbi:MAG: hypothetical protein GWO08_14370, partial [Gammaproteobacteria bacterium]|nr:hypothetical protein [Gammaproteobacteria bacterium]NIW45313.1 hypothetical protein [Gammaproteobacteria bacterium]